MILVGLSSISSFVAQKNRLEGFQEGIKNEESNIEIGYDFYDIWWLLKEPLVLAVNPQSEFTCCWCIWSQPWFLH